jgi:hypothetical protein
MTAVTTAAPVTGCLAESQRVRELVAAGRAGALT